MPPVRVAAHDASDEMEYDGDMYLRGGGMTFRHEPDGDMVTGGGVYLLGSSARMGGVSASMARNLPIPDPCTRDLYENRHPRNSPGGQAYPGPMGAGRAYDMVGPASHEYPSDSGHAPIGVMGSSAPYGGPEGFRAGPGRPAPSYVAGDARLGYPGYRGLSSQRGGRPGLEAVAWDPRPPHYAPDAPGAYAHLAPPLTPPCGVTGSCRKDGGAALHPRPVRSISPAQAWPREKFGSGAWDLRGPYAVLVFILVLILAMCVVNVAGAAAERRLQTMIMMTAICARPPLLALAQPSSAGPALPG